MFGVAKLTGPMAKAISKKTGIPVTTVSRVLEVGLPVVVAMVSKRAAGRKAK